MIDSLAEHVTGPYGILLAFTGGVLSFLSPCVLPLVPVYFAHLTGTAASAGEHYRRAATLTHAVVFVLGFGLVFTLIGASVGLIGEFVAEDSSYIVKDQLPILGKIAGVFLIIMGLNLAGLIRVPWLYRSYTLDAMITSPVPASAVAGGGVIAASGGGGRGVWAGVDYGRSLGVGAAFAVGWTPCIGPVLAAIINLSLVGDSVSALRCTYLLAAYSLGLGVPFILTAFAVTPITGFLRRHRGMMPIVEVTTGVLVIFMGALIFLDSLTDFNRYFDFLDWFS